MPFHAVVLRVLIASPSDTRDARAAIREAIAEWNELHAADLGVVLLPVAWETSSTPAMGGRPQAIVNEQIVDNADLLVGVFWTRIGTPTGEAQSGTAEEIGRIIDRGAPVQLYFSEQPVEPGTIDTEQLDALRAFRESMKATGLFGTFADPEDLGHQVQRDLTRTVRKLIGDGHVTSAPSAQASTATIAPAQEQLLAAPRRRLRSIAARLRSGFEGSLDDHQVSDMQDTMGEVAYDLDRLVDAVADLDDDAASSALVQRLLDIARRAREVQRRPIYLDGGQSLRDVAGNGISVFDDLDALGAEDWADLLRQKL